MSLCFILLFKNILGNCLDLFILANSTDDIVLLSRLIQEVCVKGQRVYMSTLSEWFRHPYLVKETHLA